MVHLPQTVIPAHWAFMADVTLLPEKNLSRHGRPHNAASLTGVAAAGRANEKALQPDADAARCGKELWSAAQELFSTIEGKATNSADKRCAKDLWSLAREVAEIPAPKVAEAGFEKRCGKALWAFAKDLKRSQPENLDPVAEACCAEELWKLAQEFLKANPVELSDEMLSRRLEDAVVEIRRAAETAASRQQGPWRRPNSALVKKLKEALAAAQPDVKKLKKPRKVGEPFAQYQPLVEVDLYKRRWEKRMVRHSGKTRPASAGNLPFATAERSLMWDVFDKAAPPPERLPKLQEVIRAAMQEFRIPWPPPKQARLEEKRQSPHQRIKKIPDPTRELKQAEIPCATSEEILQAMFAGDDGWVTDSTSDSAFCEAALSRHPQCP